MFSVSANEDFELRKIDIRAAFLQAKQLDRDVFLKPPKDIKKDGIIRKLKKPLLYDPNNDIRTQCYRSMYIESNVYSTSTGK